MISNERNSFGEGHHPYDLRPRPPQQQPRDYHPSQRRPERPPKPQVQEDTIRSEKIQVERKTFVLTLKENPRGRFMRITEDVGGRRDSIIIPATGLAEFTKAVADMAKLSDETPPNPA